MDWKQFTHSLSFASHTNWCDDALLSSHIILSDAHLFFNSSSLVSNSHVSTHLPTPCSTDSLFYPENRKNGNWKNGKTIQGKNSFTSQQLLLLSLTPDSKMSRESEKKQKRMPDVHHVLMYTQCCLLLRRLTNANYSMHVLVERKQKNEKISRGWETREVKGEKIVLMRRRGKHLLMACVCVFSLSSCDSP